MRFREGNRSTLYQRPPAVPPRPPRPMPQPVEPTPSTSNRIDQLMRGTDTNLGYSQANQDLVNRRGGELFLSPFSTLTDEAKNTGALQRGTPASGALSTAAFLADLVNPSFGLPIGVGGVAGAQTVNRVAQLAPDTRELYLNSLLGRLYHGAKEAPPAVLSNRGPQPQNWFQGDTFLTTSKPLARTYVDEGLYRAKVPLEVAERTNIMDLYNNPARHLDIAESPGVLDYLQQAGVNTVRHQSGHGIPTANFYTTYVNPLTGKVSNVPEKIIKKPVYAFLDPEGIKMQRLKDPLKNLRGNFDDAVYRAQFGIKNLIDRISKTGAFDPDNVL
jgi:hypothetical protein